MLPYIFREESAAQWTFYSIFRCPMRELAVRHESDNTVLSDERHFHEGITRWNYFPNQKLSAEIPPSITSRRFTPEVAKKVLGCSKNDLRKKEGFDFVEYRSTRYNNISRTLGLIHPFAMANIVQTLMDNYSEVIAGIQSPESAIKVDSHHDGRMLIMNYGNHDDKERDALSVDFGKNYRVHTDIANCFGSIYTHSLEWAIQGFEVAKANLGKNNNTHWSTKIDKALQLAKRKETIGIPVGPGVSSVAVDLILSKVDEQLRHKYSFVRYVDDYTASCSTSEQANDFILDLSKELASYRLTLNLSKTRVDELPNPLQEGWVALLLNAAPPTLQTVETLSTKDAFRFLDYAVKLNKDTPDGSVLKFAITMIAGHVKDAVAGDVLRYVINLCWHFPVLLPLLENIDARSDYIDKLVIGTQIDEIIQLNAKYRRSDGICWGLYYLERLGIDPSELSISAIFENKDCIALTLLSRFTNALDRVVAHAKCIEQKHIYLKDQNWLLLYQLFFAGAIGNPYSDELYFDVLKAYDVNFLCEPNVYSKAERYCFALSNPFANPGDPVQDFDSYVTD
jgi:hypothetical protein